MRPTQKRRGTWHRPIRALLLLLLVVDIVSIPLLLIPNGMIPIGTVMLPDLLGPATSPPRFPELYANDVSVLVERDGLGQHLLYSIGHGLAFVAATLPMLVYARRLMDVAFRSDPFTPAMVRKLRTLGLMVLVGGLLCETVEYAANRVLLEISLPDDASLRFGAAVDQYPSLWWLLPSFILLAVSEVVRRGCDLRAELDGVI